MKQQTEALGNCLETSFNLLADYNIGKHNPLFKNEIPIKARLLFGEFGEPVLAQGIVWSDQTKWHLHSWVEDEKFCYDFANGHEAILNKDQYYRVGKIKNVKRYSYKEATNKAFASGMYDFWDFKRTKVYKENSVESL
jgi:hypothetical protein